MLWVLPLALLGQTPFERVHIEPQRTIIDLAFDPARYDQPSPSVSIRYLGDDHAYPVYAIAINRKCRGTRECRPAIMARMVRSPNFKTAQRPRWAGMAVVRHVQKAEATTREAVAAALDTAGLEWLEADLSNCPGGAAILADLSSMTWARPVEMSRAPSPGNVPPPPPPPPLHADRISVAFDDWASGRAIYSGVIDDARPTGWAVRLAAGLEQCWKPSKQTPPWRR